VQNVVWYYASGEKAKGPFSTEQMQSLLEQGTLSLETYVCEEGETKPVTLAGKALWREPLFWHDDPAIQLF